MRSRAIEREPPTERPNNDAWNTNARAPGSEKTGRISTGRNCVTLSGSAAVAPAKPPPLKATKKNLSILGFLPPSSSRSQSGFAACSIFSAIRADSSIEYPGGTKIRASKKLAFPSGR